MPPLGLVRRPPAGRKPGGRGAEKVGQGLEEPFARAEADLFESGLVDEREDVDAHLVRCRRLRRVLEPEFGEPSVLLGHGESLATNAGAAPAGPLARPWIPARRRASAGAEDQREGDGHGLGVDGSTGRSARPVTGRGRAR